MKSLLKYKIERIEELEKQVEHLESALDKEKVKYHEKLDKEREQFQRSIDFLKEQISLKDKRMDMLLDAVFTKDVQHKELLEVILSCPARKIEKCGE
jgi:predicted RNase H-like nuclease (RuvC/YqgF family)